MSFTLIIDRNPHYWFRLKCINCIKIDKIYKECETKLVLIFGLVWSHNSLISHLVKTYFLLCSLSPGSSHQWVLSVISSQQKLEKYLETSLSDNIFKKHIAFVWMGGWKLYFSTIWKMFVFIPPPLTVGNRTLTQKKRFLLTEVFTNHQHQIGNVACLGLICQTC